jgi:hypothetical protein
VEAKKIKMPLLIIAPISQFEPILLRIKTFHLRLQKNIVVPRLQCMQMAQSKKLQIATQSKMKSYA